jgi:flagellar L-ring protein precursor FlgH
VGDLLTVVVDEQTAARERVSTVATGNRDLQARMNAGLTDDDIRLGPQKGFGTGMQNNSRDVGEANRVGDLTAVLTVRVASVEAPGVYRIEGKKSVVVDGRTQDIALTGLVRSEDVTAGHTVVSGRIAEAVITYKGKKIGPRTGIVGKILGMLWP